MSTAVVVSPQRARVTRSPDAPISDREFALFQRLVLQHSGIALTDAKRQLLVSRLGKRLRTLGFPTFGDYYRHVTSDASGEELVRLIDLISTNETHFFREREHFDWIEKQLVPTWRADAAAGDRLPLVRVWSAACSTGQEAYSLGMLLLDTLPASEAWRIEILGTDISTRVLQVAAGATWALTLSREIPSHLLSRYMLRGSGAQEGKMRAGRELRSIVRFRRLNLQDANYDVDRRFDLILCRNVLIYFTADTRRQVVNRLAGHLVPGGHLIVGHAESVHGSSGSLRSVAPTIYTTND